MRPQRKVNIWIKYIPSHDDLFNSLNLLTYPQEKEEDLLRETLLLFTDIWCLSCIFKEMWTETACHPGWKFEEATHTSPGPLPSTTWTGLGSKVPVVQNLGSTHSQGHRNVGLALAWPREWGPEVPRWPHPRVSTARRSSPISLDPQQKTLSTWSHPATHMDMC